MTSILVVDDCETDRRLVGGLLGRDRNWTVAFAHHGADALQQMESHLPDVVVTDLHMPVMNGLELVRHVRREYPLVPVILITSQETESISLQALRLGAASYSPKATLSSDLVETVKSVLEVSGEQVATARLLQRITANSVAFELDNDNTLVGPLIRYLQERMLISPSFDDADRIRIGVALEESLVNAIYHGNLEVSSSLKDSDEDLFYELADRRKTTPPYSQRRVYVEARQGAQEVAFTIRDEGPGFDPQTLPDPRDPVNLDRPSGRGLLLIRTFMSEVHHNATGNQITLIKRPEAKNNGEPG